MSPLSIGLLVLSTLAFIGAASAAKAWAISSGSLAWLLLTLGLYTLGNLIMLRLIRDVGMAMALSLSAVVQLVAVNVVAYFFFGEAITPLHAAGLAIGIVAIALMTYPA